MIIIISVLNPNISSQLLKFDKKLVYEKFSAFQNNNTGTRALTNNLMIDAKLLSSASCQVRNSIPGTES